MTAKEIAERAYERMHGSDLAPIHVIRQLENEIKLFAIHIADQAIEWLENQKRLAKFLEAPANEQELLESLLKKAKDARKQLTEQ